MEPTASGVLGKTPLAHLIVYCLDKRLRGALIIRPEGDPDPGHADVITLVDGFPAKIRVADPIEHLGRILVEVGAIDDAAYNESLMRMSQQPGVLHGKLLLEANKIDAAALERGLRTQVARKLGHLFTRPATTTYAYYEGQDFLQRYGGPELFPVDPLPTLWGGVRTNPSMPHVDATLERVGQQSLRVRVGADFKRFDLSRAEQDLIARLGAAPLTVAEALASARDPRTARLLLYVLLLTKHLEVAPRASVTRLPAAAPSTAPDVGSSAVVRPSVGNVFAAAPVAPVAAAAPKPAPPKPAPASAQASASDATPRPVSGGRRAEIVARAKRIEKENYPQMLGLGRDASIEDTKAAYFQLAKVWHPDRLAPELADVRSDAVRIFGLMVEAYQTLTDPDRRARYLQLLDGGGGTPEDQAEVAKVMDASNAFQKADFFVTKGSLAEAEPFAKTAVELDPSTPEHVALVVWIEANKPARRESGSYADLLARLDATLAESPRCERARFYRGMIRKSAGRFDEAMHDFKAVVENNPKHVEALREVRLHTMRNDKDKRGKDDGSGGGLFGKLLKKK